MVDTSDGGGGGAGVGILPVAYAVGEVEDVERSVAERVVAPGVEAVAAVGIEGEARGLADQGVGEDCRVVRVGGDDAAQSRGVLENGDGLVLGHRRIVDTGDG